MILFPRHICLTLQSVTNTMYMYSPLSPFNSLIYIRQTGIFIPIEQMGKLRLQWLIGEAIVQMSGKVISKTCFCFWLIDSPIKPSYDSLPYFILRSLLLNALWASGVGHTYNLLEIWTLRPHALSTDAECVF